jgi:hypothetical protein
LAALTEDEERLRGHFHFGGHVEDGTNSKWQLDLTRGVLITTTLRKRYAVLGTHRQDEWPEGWLHRKM